MREIILDTETTGLDFKRGDRVIEVACIELFNHIPTGKTLQFYCSTEKKIDEQASKVHGLTNAFLKKFPPFEKQAKNLLAFIGDDLLVIHNADFDLNFINNELVISGLSKIKNKVLDTVSFARKKLDTRSASLDYLCKRFSIDTSARKFHGALLDCELLSEVYIELLGGRQKKLDLQKSKNTPDKPNEKKDFGKHKNTQIKLSKETIDNHKAFVGKINNSIWKKINY